MKVQLRMRVADECGIGEQYSGLCSARMLRPIIVNPIDLGREHAGEQIRQNSNTYTFSVDDPVAN